jgi:hypothetical protein
MNALPHPILLVMAIIYVWMLYNVAVLASRRFKRFSLLKLLISLTDVSLLMEAAVVL